MVGVDNSSLQQESRPNLVGLVRGLVCANLGYINDIINTII